jgi:hypothetical protein
VKPILLGYAIGYLAVAVVALLGWVYREIRFRLALRKFERVVDKAIQGAEDVMW